MVVVSQVAGIGGFLSRGWVLLLQLAVAGVVLLLIPPGQRSEYSSPHRSFYRLVSALTTRQWAFVVASVVAVALVTLSVVLSLSRPTISYDTLNYHLPNVAFWLQQASLRHLPFSQPTYFTNAYPSNGELTALWLILPTHSNVIAFVMPTLYGILCVLSLTLLAKQLGAQPWAGLATALAVVATPLVTSTQIDGLLTDLAGVSGLVVGMTCALEMRASAQPWRWALMGGLCVGLSIGAKDTALLPGLAVILVLLVLSGRTHRFQTLALSIGGVFLLTGFWYIRNWVLIGNPIFPESLSLLHKTVFAGPKGGPLVPYDTSMVSQLLHGRMRPISIWTHSLYHLLGPALIIVALGAVGGIVASFRSRSPGIIAVTSIAWISGIAYLATPYTGGDPSGHGILIYENIRYALPAVCFTAAITAAVIPEWLVALIVSGTLAFDLYRIAQLSARRSRASSWH